MRFALILLCACAGFGQTPAIDRVTNLSNDRDPICPGSLVYIYGNFGSGSNDSASVVVNGKAAAVITAAVLPTAAGFPPGLILAQLAWDTSPGPASITVEKAGAKSAPFPLRVESYGPYFLQNPFGATNEQVLFLHNESCRQPRLRDPGRDEFRRGGERYRVLYFRSRPRLQTRFETDNRDLDWDLFQ